MGSSSLQGPHQVAQKSIKTGNSDYRASFRRHQKKTLTFSTSSSKLSSYTSPTQAINRRRMCLPLCVLFTRRCPGNDPVVTVFGRRNESILQRVISGVEKLIASTVSMQSFLHYVTWNRRRLRLPSPSTTPPCPCGWPPLVAVLCRGSMETSTRDYIGEADD